MGFKLIVFDWDGTLMDSEAEIVASMQAAFEDFGNPPPDREAARNIIGLGLTEAMPELWPAADAVQRSRVADRYRSHYRSTDGISSRLFPGARKLIDWLLQ